MPFMYAPDGPKRFGWFKKPVTSVAEFTKLRFRISSGLPSDVLKDMGGIPMNLAGAELIPAAERGLIDGVEWINPANDIKVGLQDVFKFYSIQGLHQAIDIADVLINGAKWRALPPDLQAIVESRAHREHVEAHGLLPPGERQGAERDQGQGRHDVRRARPTMRRPSSRRRRKCWRTSRRRMRSSRRCSTRSAPSRRSSCPTARETSKLSTLISAAAD